MFDARLRDLAYEHLAGRLEGDSAHAPPTLEDRLIEASARGYAALMAEPSELVLPKMRAQRWGKIVNVGSMGGRLTFPGGGHYHATKHALEAISDALRFELRGFGIDVILLEPGLITTEFGNAAAASMARGSSPPAHDGADPYGEFNAAVGAVTQGAYDGPMRRLGAGPERVARTIERALRRRRAPTRIVITPSAKLTIALRRMLSDRAWDAAMRQQFPQPR